MTTDTTALLISVLFLILIAAWVPFLDTCAGWVHRKRQRGPLTPNQRRPLVPNSPQSPARPPQVGTSSLSDPVP